MLAFCLLLLFGRVCLALVGGLPPIANDPPRGWNSWDCYGTLLNETELMRNVNFMAKYLLPYGFSYATVDMNWQGGIDKYGRSLPDVRKWPSAQAGFKPVADKVHQLGLKFGIWIGRGIPKAAVKANTPVYGTKYFASDIVDPSATCPWDGEIIGLNMSHPGASAYYQSIVSLYVEWGVDLIKADCLFAVNYRPLEIKSLSAAIQQASRPILFSLSPGKNATSEQAEEIQEYAHMYRITEDFHDPWDYPQSSVPQHFITSHLFSRFIGPNHWPDLDMLPFGIFLYPQSGSSPRKTYFTQEEQVTIMSLWCIARSPLIIGATLYLLDNFTLSILTNPEVLQLHTNARNPHQISRYGTQSQFIVWAADVNSSPDNKYVAFFNLGTNTSNVTVNFYDLGLNTTQPYSIRDLWKHSNIGSATGNFSYPIAQHGSALFLISS